MDRKMDGWRNKRIRNLKLALYCFQSVTMCLLSPYHVPSLVIYLCCMNLESRSVNDLTLNVLETGLQSQIGLEGGNHNMKAARTLGWAFWRPYHGP